MASVRDLWTSPTPDKTSSKKRLPNARWGKGKRWQVRWEENGEPASATMHTRDAADELKARIEVGQADGTWVTRDKRELTLADLWEPWIASRADASEKTRKDYESLWNVHVRPVWGRLRAEEIEQHVVVTWLAGLTTMKGVKAGGEPRPLGSSSRRKIGMMMRSILDLAVKVGAVRANPLDSKDVPKQKKAERRYLKITEVDALLDAAPTPAATLLLRVLLMTGLRPGEAKGLKVKDLDAGRGRLLIRRDVDDLGRVDETKNRHHRDVPIGGELLRELTLAAEGRDDNAWLVPDEHGNVWTTARWRVIWSNLLIWTGTDKTLKTYELRHTAASMAIASGADVKTIQLMLGHASAAETLDIYGHLWEEGLDSLPGAIEDHMARERARAAAASEKKSAAMRAGFRVLDGGAAG